MFFSLSTHHPLHQGLKRITIPDSDTVMESFLPIIHYTKDWNVSLKRPSQSLTVTFYPSSTTPRIETRPGVWTSYPGSGNLSTHHPLHQGLKPSSSSWAACKKSAFLPIIHYTKDWNWGYCYFSQRKLVLSTHHPLHQGLKQSCQYGIHSVICLFLPIIHYTKDWNLHISCHPSPLILLSTHHPLHKGLKRGICGSACGDPVCFLPIIHYTKDWNHSHQYHHCDALILSTHHPLHQGLKRDIWLQIPLVVEPFYPSSTTPRIETSLRPIPSTGLSFFLPIIHYTKDWNAIEKFPSISSGNFLPIIHYTKDWNSCFLSPSQKGHTLSTHHPLHQGLKP